jgi:hypothetical protein
MHKEVDAIKIYEMPYGVEIVQYPAQCVVVRTIKEAKAIMDSLSSFIEYKERN